MIAPQETDLYYKGRTIKQLPKYHFASMVDIYYTDSLVMVMESSGLNTILIRDFVTGKGSGMWKHLGKVLNTTLVREHNNLESWE